MMSTRQQISFTQMELHMDRARQVRAEILGGGIRDLLSVSLRQFKLLARPLRREARALSASLVPESKTAIQPAE